MKCNRCGEYVETVGDIRASRGCQDGTVQQIPAWMTDSTLISSAINAVPGLANRFVRGSAPVEAVEAVIETTKEHLAIDEPKPPKAPAKPKASKPKAPAEPKPRKKK